MTFMTVAEHKEYLEWSAKVSAAIAAEADYNEWLEEAYENRFDSYDNDV